MTDEDGAFQPMLLRARLGPDGWDVYELRHALHQRIPKHELVQAPSFDALVRLVRGQFVDEWQTEAEFCEAVAAGLAATDGGISVEASPEGFAAAVLGLVKLPNVVFLELLEETLSHLRQLEALIAKYEQDPCVAACLAGNRGRNHDERTTIAFFERCMTERAAITRYLSTGIEDEALRRSGFNYVFLKAIDPFLSLKETSPYLLRRFGSTERFDRTRIHQWRHRASTVALKEIPRLERLYEIDREAFHAELERRVPIASVFDHIDQAAGKVDRLHSRQPIFDELRKLHVAGFWSGAYALALPQVEGLFAEMAELAAPRKARSGRALPDKVRLVRAFAAVHDRNLDYFEFSVPAQRNRFSHTGRIEAPKLAAEGVIRDLGYVCSVFLELDAPVVELTRLLETVALDNLPRPTKHWARLFAGERAS